MSIKDYFSFSKSEKRGIMMLLIIILLLVISFQFIDKFRIFKQTDFTQFEKELDEFEKEYKEQKLKDSLEFIQKQSNNLPTEFFNFNPNTINDSDWSKLGLENWQIKTINNYKSKGGEFRIKSDVKKIYGMKDTLYNLLYPYIELPDSSKRNNSTNWESQNNYPKKNYTKFEKEKLSIDINLCDTTELQKLKGIGSGYAKRIIKYRESLGGFINVNQLKEVYGFNDNLFNQISPYIKISNNNPNRININEIDVEQLKKHPYIGWKLAKLIVAYRKTHGNFKDVSEIRKIHLITDEIYSKIAPYLTVN
ncbi:MAG: helix-hairpin-helix domain-containing protein [Flavobacteriales bacterium]|nr:helix-hairpin-helix domain-containing protein [Flavobacteriales bacterium]